MPRTRFPRLGLWTLAALALVAFVVGLSLLSSQFLDSASDPAGSVRPSAQPVEAREIDGSALVDVSTPSARALPEVPNAGAYRLRVVDEEGDPVAGAEAWLEDEIHPRLSDADGILRFVRSGASGLVFADGFTPHPFLSGLGEQTLQLEVDAGVELSVLWADDGAPVVGADVDKIVGDAEDFDEQLEDFAPSPPTDQSGRTRVLGLLGYSSIRLRVTHPVGTTVWQPLPAEWPEDEGPPRFEIRMPRDSQAFRVRVVDAQDRPLADRVVVLDHFEELTRTTDADGWVSFAVQVNEASNEDEAPVVLVLERNGDGPRWFGGPLARVEAGGHVTIRVAPVRIHGRVESASPGSYLVASLAGDESRIESDFVQWPSSFAAMEWTPVGSDGSFELGSGWQGEMTWVFVRHHAFETPFDEAQVPRDGGAVVLRAPEVCHVSIEMDRPVRVSGRIEFSRVAEDEERQDATVSYMGESTTVALEELGESIDLPCATYFVSGELEGGRWFIDKLDATGPTASLSLEVPVLTKVRGTLTGSLRGPLAGRTLTLASGRSYSSTPLFTDSDGGFAGTCAADGPIFVRPTWDEQDRYFELLGRPALEPAVDPAQPVVHYVLEESLLRIVERPRSPLLEFRRVWIERTDVKGKHPRRELDLDFDEQGADEIHLPPGSYVVSRKYGLKDPQEVHVTLERDQRVELVLDSSRLAAIAFDVTVPDPENRRLRLRVVDSEGSMAVLRTLRDFEGGVMRIREVVEPGTYSVEIESRIRSERLTEAPLDVWRGEFTAVPGAQVPLRIHLR